MPRRRRALLTVAASEQFWQQRPVFLINRYDLLEERKAERLLRLRTRDATTATKKAEFMRRPEIPTTTREEGCRVTSGHLEFWAIHRSWNFCPECKVLTTEKLLPDYRERPVLGKATGCSCSRAVAPPDDDDEVDRNKYHSPKVADFPAPLRGLSNKEVVALRPVDLHVGDYSMKQHGYRKKTNAARVIWSAASPADKIAALPQQSRQRCAAAYDYLMASGESSYSRFVLLREAAVNAETTPFCDLYDETFNVGIECALWPTLYPKTSWCETTLSSCGMSAKRSFMMKVFGEVIDYALHYELMQFVFDRWLFTTVSGALSVGNAQGCSSPTSLSSKTFSPGYWQDQHLYLVDALRQYGFPTLFLTISPYEWSFPFPQWLEAVRDATGLGPTQLPGMETNHIMHVLEQLVRGYLTGCNDKRWCGHLLTNAHKPSEREVLTYFYRFEFQDRGTPHLHMLVWLKDLRRVPLHLFRADIPWQDPSLAFLVQDLQASNSSPLQVNEERTSATHGVLKMFHPEEAFAINLRAYISTVLPALKCRMDVQSTDGKGKVLRYVTSYVAKSHDSFATRGLYSEHVVPSAAARRFVKEMCVTEPEMWQMLADRKVSWSNSTRRLFVPPHTEAQCADNATVQKYWARPVNQEHWTLLEWLRKTNTNKNPPQPYADGSSCLVGVKYCSIYKEKYFFQHLLVNHHHRNTTSLRHPRHDQLPEQICAFAAAMFHLPDAWSSQATVEQMLSDEGNRDSYCQTASAYVASKIATLKLWQRRVINNQDLLAMIIDRESGERFPIAAEQIGARELMLTALRQRVQFYDAQNIDSTVDEHLTEDDWRRPIVIKGRPGTGKTQLVMATIDKALHDLDANVLVVTPTGFLSSRYRSTFGEDIKSDTVHGAFLIPVDNTRKPDINWSIKDSDLLVMDEVSMVPERLFDHVMSTMEHLSKRPLLVATGDERQQQPIDTVDGRTVGVPNIMSNRRFKRLSRSITLTTQHRCVDDEFSSLLEHLRHWPATDAILDTLNLGRVLCPGEIDLSRVIDNLMANPDSTLLSYTRNTVSKVNSAMLSSLFVEHEAIDSFRLDDGQEAPRLIYPGMRVIITQNRDKRMGVVNGQEAVVKYAEGHVIFLALTPSDTVVAVHPVTYQVPGQSTPICVLPFVPGYATTIAKAQGQTLTKALIWMDFDNIPTGTGYVALSRVKRLNDITLVTPLQKQHLMPVRL